MSEESLSQIRKRLETISTEVQSALEDVKNLQRNKLEAASQEMKQEEKKRSSASASTLKVISTPTEIPSWSLSRWISIMVLSLILPAIFLPGLLPLYLMSTGRSIHDDRLTPWLFGIESRPGEVLWVLATIISGMALFFGSVTLILWLLIIACSDTEGPKR